MKTRLLLPFLLIGMFASGCQEAVDPVYYEYLGLWESSHWRIELYQNGSGLFDSNKWPFQRHIEGWVRINDRKIRIIGENDRKVLTIDTPPTVEVDPVTGVEYTYMVLDGETVYRTF
jgi:hypothetical protein